jgi:predicted site-specific integrase-resolvase
MNKGEVTNWRERATVTVDEYAAIVGVSRATAYAAVRAGEVAVLRVQNRILVSVSALIRQLEG